MFDPYHKWLGIPPAEQPPTHYRLLGVAAFEDDPDVIDAAANRQMGFVQGCATGPHTAASQKLLNELSAARVCLLSPDKKAAYDAALRVRVAPEEAIPPPPGPQVGPRPTPTRPDGRPPPRPSVEPPAPDPVFEFDAGADRPPRRAGARGGTHAKSRLRVLLGVGTASAAVLSTVVWAVGLRSNPRPGTVVVEVDPPGAEVYVDGVRWAAAGSDDAEPIRGAVPPGTRHLRVVKDGFASVSREIAVPPGGQEVVRVRLEAVPVARTTVSLTPAKTPLPQPAPVPPDRPAEPPRPGPTPVPENAGGVSNPPNKPSPPPVMPDLIARLNDLKYWKENGGTWETRGQAIVGTRAPSLVFTSLQFAEELPLDCTIEFDLTVVKGQRPRVFFGGKPDWYVGTEGDKQTLYVYGPGASGVQGTPYPYRLGQSLHMKVVLSGDNFTVWVNDKLTARGRRKSSTGSILRLSPGDNFSAGTITVSNIRLREPPKK